MTKFTSIFHISGNTEPGYGITGLRFSPGLEFAKNDWGFTGAGSQFFTKGNPGTPW